MTTSGSEVELMAFASNATANPDAFVVLNRAHWGSQPIRVRVLGSRSASFRGYRTTGDLESSYSTPVSLKTKAGAATGASSGIVIRIPSPLRFQ